MHIEKFYNFNPGEQRIQVVSEIPKTATIGKATVSANMFSDYPKMVEPLLPTSFITIRYNCGSKILPKSKGRSTRHNNNRMRRLV
jgi:hypothetical protein